MQTVRTVSHVVQIEEAVREKPEFSIGDYMRVEFGQHEGHSFWIRGVRYNHDRRCFEYLYQGFMGGWLAENQISLITPISETPDEPR